VTPSHPEYPSAHTTVGGSALGFYTAWFGSAHFPLTFKGNAGAVRQYADIDDAIDEEGDARVWGGMHWRNSVDVGASLGTRVGKYTARHLLKPLDDHCRTLTADASLVAKADDSRCRNSQGEGG